MTHYGSVTLKMKTMIEVGGEPVSAEKTPGGWLVVNQAGEPVVGSVLVMLCADCDHDKALTKGLKASGYDVSHGMCESCGAEFMKRLVLFQAKEKLYATT